MMYTINFIMNESTQISHFNIKKSSLRGGTTKQSIVFMTIEIASIRY